MGCSPGLRELLPGPPCPSDNNLALEERGLAMTATALRFAYAFGGDGESNIKVCAEGACRA